MLNRVIAFSLQNRVLIAALSLIVMLYGGYLLGELKVDVLPDLNRPTVTIMTEAPGLAERARARNGPRRSVSSRSCRIYREM